jgi:histidinol dehydrogenase
VGPFSAVSLGDYVIGTNHTLPTAGAARFGSPLGVHTFLKRTSVARLDAEDLESLQQAARTLARMEGLSAHANAVEVRLR